jgi:hypothetical protein
VKRAAVIAAPHADDEDAALDDLPAIVLSNADLVRRLCQRVNDYRCPGEDVAEAERTASPRELQAVVLAVNKLVAAYKRLPRRITTAALMGTKLSRQDLFAALARLQYQAHVGLLKPAKSGPKTILRGRLERGVADDLHGAGIKLTKARGGILARTLVVVYDAAGIAAPQYDSLFPKLKALADHRR